MAKYNYRYANQQEVIDAAIGFLEKKKMAGEATGEDYNSPSPVREFIKLHIGAEEKEVFFVMFLNTRHKLIAAEKMFSGDIDCAAVYPRQILRTALEHNCAVVILGHNHPGGCAEPSVADRRITERVSKALSHIDIRVLDHIIVTKLDSYSFAENGLI